LRSTSAALAWSGNSGDAEAGAQHQGDALVGEGLVERGVEPLGHLHGRLPVGAGQQGREAVAGVPGQEGAGREQHLESVADLAEQLVGGGEAEGVADLPEGVEVDADQGHARTRRSGPTDLPLQVLGERLAVGQLRHRVVHGLVGLLRRLVLQRGDQPPVLQGHPAVAGEGGEDPQVVLDEGADLGEPVHHQHGAGRQPVGGHGHHHAVLDPDLGQPARERVTGLDQAGLALGQQHGEIGQQLAGLGADPGHVLAPGHQTGRWLVVPHGRQQQRPVLGPQDLPRSAEHLALELQQLQRPPDVPREVVQRLEVLVPLRQLRVRAVEDEQDPRHCAEQHSCRRPLP
jgi:hypothetical protein